ncbi:carbonic anhydrase [Rhodoluna sp.]|uniref:carbonic anhydrase n=1 Tax=Rhodoluna sp. TaxID=1969481 RepID=UPI0025F4B409|nr:carbonic anhydrase [Rhodoluna sp.]
MADVRPSSPQQAWLAMKEGNQRFVGGTPAHPRQDIDRRSSLAAKQIPFAALFGCADSRLSAEIIFDVGLGDLFVVRNAGQVIAETILGSLEYSVEVLGVPLILVLGHDECGAIRATIDATEGKLNSEGEFIHDLVERIRPTVLEANAAGFHDIDDVTALHIKDTINELLTRSKLIAKAVASGKLAVVGANYKLTAGEVHPLVMFGDIN